MTSEITPSARKDRGGRVRRDLFLLDNDRTGLQASKIKLLVFVYKTFSLLFLLETIYGKNDQLSATLGMKIMIFEQIATFTNKVRLDM